MDKLEEIQVKIKKQEEGLWSLEDDYRTAKKKIEESYESLDHNRSQLTRLSPTVLSWESKETGCQN